MKVEHINKNGASMNIKTIKKYILVLREIELISPRFLKGFYKLPEKVQNQLVTLDAEISNLVNEIEIFK